jgi:hypothetical protein
METESPIPPLQESDLTPVLGQVRSVYVFPSSF